MDKTPVKTIEEVKNEVIADITELINSGRFGYVQTNVAPGTITISGLSSKKYLISKEST